MAEPLAAAHYPSGERPRVPGKRAGRRQPRRIGPYLLGETLGEGGFSKVKLGVHEETGRRVALKIMRRDKLGGEDSLVRRQVVREVQAMSRVQHGHVLRLHEVLWDARYTKSGGRQVEVLVVVLELAPGGELFEFLSFTGCFEEAIARTYFRQLVAGVEACHRLGVSHRDLKPENLLLDASFQLKIADFGFAGAFGGLRQVLFTECGTPGYMAPEVAEGAGYDPALADVWACGVILFVMLAGFPPFQRPNDDDWWFHKLKAGRHDLFWQAHSRSAYFSEPTRDFCNRVLCPDPRRRMTVEAMKRHPWFSGRTIPDQELAVELGRRKRAVDAERRRGGRRGAGATAAAGLSSTTDEGDDFGDAALDREKMRGSVDLPPGPPARWTSVGGGGGGGGGGDLAVVASTRSLCADGDAGDGGSAGDGDGELPPPPVYEAEAGGVRHYASFSSVDAPRVVLRRLSEALDRLSAQHTVQAEDYRVKASVTTDAGSRVRLVAQVFADPAREGVCVCEFRRRKGDSMVFHQVFADLREQLCAVLSVDGEALAEA